ncbi:MAG: DUF726 domain-containing protein [Bacteroidales bacterium]|nr:DUF726 domain-containing protein [Bacteroidales bacterium]
MKDISEIHKEKFHKQVKKINNNDEVIVKDKIQDEINFLKQKNDRKLDGLIRKAELLAEIIKCDEFFISETSRKWIVFGLNYLVSDVDIIPDAIPIIGYTDDNMVLSWVSNLVKRDIHRYKEFINAKTNNSSILNHIIEGDGEHQIILFPGFFESKTEVINSDWVKLLGSLNVPYKTAGISIFNWEVTYLHELNKTLPVIDHELKLKPDYDTEYFGIEWQQLKTDLNHLGKQLSMELYNIKKDSPNKKIIAVCMNAGAIPLFTAIEMTNRTLVDNLYLFGATCSERRFLKVIGNKDIIVYNFFSDNDYALRFIYDNYELQSTPIGLGELHRLRTTSVINTNASSIINKHQDYRYKFVELMNSIKN